MASTAKRGTSKRGATRTSSGPVRVGIIGTKFMGKAHANAWLSAGRFFDLPRAIVMQSASGRDEQETGRFAENWGWKTCTTDWRKLIEDPEVTRKIDALAARGGPLAPYL